MKIWRDMTDEEKGALLLAKHKGEYIQTTIENRYPEGWHIVNPQWCDDQYYRVKPAGPVYRTTSQTQWVIRERYKLPVLENCRSSTALSIHGKLTQTFKDDVLVEFTWTRADDAGN